MCKMKATKNDLRLNVLANIKNKRSMRSNRAEFFVTGGKLKVPGPVYFATNRKYTCFHNTIMLPHYFLRSALFDHLAKLLTAQSFQNFKHF